MDRKGIIWQLADLVETIAGHKLARYTRYRIATEAYELIHERIQSIDQRATLLDRVQELEALIQELKQRRDGEQREAELG